MTMVVNERAGDLAIAAVEPEQGAVSWGAIIAGAVAAAAVSLLLMLLGSGLGFAAISPWTATSSTLTTVAASALIWLVVVHWIGSAVGGYMAGRLRTNWTDIERHEVFFRDTAHGFLAWGVAVLLVAALSGMAASAVLFSGVQAVSTVVGGAAQAVAQGTAQGVAQGAAQGSNPADPTAYFVDSLFRPASAATATASAAPAAGAPAAAATPAATGSANGGASNTPATAETRGEVSRILVRDIAMDMFPTDDRTYLANVVATSTGVSADAARMRVDGVINAMNDAKTKAKDVADKARKAAATAAIGLVLALLIGAFVSSVAAAFAGHLRDEPNP